MNPIEIMQKIYDTETNVSIESFWDAGWTFKYGGAPGYTGELYTTDSLEDGFKWLDELLKGG